ncbi:exodeoxyribonuclease VII large subunit [endosymbiont 'TC1' of Trimyema compressum]|uniref:exodeoxyribonuclease VII large subunit n=1 Tax=endosymbiont 'TC1' of Trimyema compressum TaxID=243899 RepID=UPI000A4C78C6|nr:exodeoxyribonuclease VII large subunit [endosymbiont 'TC1' of Trimyema compressum]
MVKLSVSEVNNYVKVLLEKDLYLSNICIKGEVSNFKRAMSGHLYFTLKDNKNAIQSVIFRSHAERMKMPIKEGVSILIKGKVSLYPVTGQYQFYGEKVVMTGVGNIYLEIEALKKKFQQEGLFEIEYKKQLPEAIETIGVVTSLKGAVLHDIKTVVASRNPSVKLVLIPVGVQGEKAPFEIAEAIESFNEYGKVDVLIVGRGGGSVEDLMAFNTEPVVRAIFNSKIPVISAVGHETDITLSDFVADVRGATPSQGAEIATENIWQKMTYYKNRLIKEKANVEKNIDNYYQQLDPIYEKLKNFKGDIENLNKSLDTYYGKLIREISVHLEIEKNALNHKGEKLHLMSPLALLNKGYSITYNDEKNIVKKVNDVSINDIIKTALSTGVLTCKVIGKEEENGC